MSAIEEKRLLLQIEKTEQLRAELAQMRERNDRLEAVAEAAKKYEYIEIGATFELDNLAGYYYSHLFCPSCGYKKPDGHWKDCELGLALAALDGAL